MGKFFSQRCFATCAIVRVPPALVTTHCWQQAQAHWARFFTHPHMTVVWRPFCAGWSSWNAFGGAQSADKMVTVADAIIKTGLRDLGYTNLVSALVHTTTLIMLCCNGLRLRLRVWRRVRVHVPAHNAQHRVDTPPFPSPVCNVQAVDGGWRSFLKGGPPPKGSRGPVGWDFVNLTSYYHANGLKLGMYVTGGFEAVYEHEAQWAEVMFKEWGADGVKVRRTWIRAALCCGTLRVAVCCAVRAPRLAHHTHALTTSAGLTSAVLRTPLFVLFFAHLVLLCVVSRLIIVSLARPGTGV